MYKLHTQCRACGVRLEEPEGTKATRQPSSLVPVLDLGPMPLVNDFRKEQEERAGYAPLRVMYCKRCTLAQLSVTVTPEVLYTNYSYVTLGSESMLAHFDALKKDLVAQQGTLGNVLEIGSNNGMLLSYLKPDAAAVFGVDPAENLAKEAVAAGVPTMAHGWDHFAAAHVEAELGRVDTIIARHVFCHINDWRMAINAIDSVCHERTLVALEVPWVMDLLDGNQWDTIYHEHLSYMSIGAMKALLRGTKLDLVRVQHYPVHGGAVVLYLRKRRDDLVIDSSVQTFHGAEFNRLSAERWQRLGLEARKAIDGLRSYVRGLRQQGKRVVGYGASAKGTNWVAACGFNAGDLECVYDTTVQKWYRTVPGTDIPVKSASCLYAEAANYAVLFCWNFEADVLAKEGKWLAGGGKFIIPVPELRVVGAAEAKGTA